MQAHMAGVVAPKPQISALSFPYHIMPIFLAGNIQYTVELYFTQTFYSSFGFLWVFQYKNKAKTVAA